MSKENNIVNLENLNFQIDLINKEVIQNPTLVGFLNNSSKMSEHIKDQELEIIRWWFDSFEIALDALYKIGFTKGLTHRLICIEKGLLFIQKGNFL